MAHTESGPGRWGLLCVFFCLACLWPGPAAAQEDKGEFAGFRRSLNTTVHGYAVVGPPHPVRAGNASERFEVRPGDCGAHAAWDDCASDRERSELSETGDRAESGETWWYGWSFFLPRDWPDISPAKTCLGQFHQQGSRRPVLMFLNAGGGLCLDFTQVKRGCLELVPADELRGRWHDIVVMARFSPGADGLLKAWVDGVLKVDESGPLMRGPGVVYFKYGVYRSFLSRYGNGTAPAQAAYFDEVRKGRSRAGVEPGGGR